MKVVAGLDLSLTAAGVAILEGETAHLYTFGYGLKKDSTDRDRMERVIFIANSVMGVLMKHKATCVGIEQYGFASKGKISMQADLGGTIKTQIYVGLKSVPVLLNAMSARKYLMGEATKDKKKIKRWIEAKGFKPSNTDESDALVIALVMDDWANRRTEISDVHKMEVINRIDFHQSKTAMKIGATA